MGRKEMALAIDCRSRVEIDFRLSAILFLKNLCRLKSRFDQNVCSACLWKNWSVWKDVPAKRMLEFEDFECVHSSEGSCNFAIIRVSAFSRYCFCFERRIAVRIRNLMRKLASRHISFSIVPKLLRVFDKEAFEGLRAAETGRVR